MVFLHFRMNPEDSSNSADWKNYNPLSQELQTRTQKMNLQHLQVAHAFQAQITAATSYLQPISDNQVAACVFATCDFPYHPQSAASSRTSNTSSVLQTLRSLLSQGNQAPGPGVSYSSQLCLRSIALAWYARILSTILAFCFSNSCYLTFKVGHRWRTGHLFCLPISSDAGWNAPCLQSLSEHETEWVQTFQANEDKYI